MKPVSSNQAGASLISKIEPEPVEADYDSVPEAYQEEDVEQSPEDPRQKP